MDCAEIVQQLGYPGDDKWGFDSEETRSDLTQVHVRVSVWVRESLVIPGGSAFKKLQLNQWGSASKQNANAEGEAETIAVKLCLMWFGLMPKMAESYGVSDILNTLGPAGRNWGFRTLKCEVSAQMRRLHVETWIKPELLHSQGERMSYVGITPKGEVPAEPGLDEESAEDEKVKKPVTKSSWGSIVHTDPQGIVKATACAIRNSLKWYCVPVHPLLEKLEVENLESSETENQKIHKPTIMALVGLLAVIMIASILS